MGIVWYISAVIAYRDNTWTSAELRYDEDGFFSTGPDISRLPEIVSLLQNIGLNTQSAIPDPNIRDLTYRFSVLVANDSGDIRVAGGTDDVAVIADDLAEVRTALAQNTYFEEYLDLTSLSPSASPSPSPSPAPINYVSLVIFTGESNSGGYAQNASATVDELASRPNVQIFDNTNLDSFDALDIGTNNLLGHSGLSNGNEHGFELGLANSVDAGRWDVTPVYLVKTGQGGSTISQWGQLGTYFQTFITRVTTAIEMLENDGYVVQPYVWYSHGINDAIAGTPVATWKAAAIDWFSRIRDVLGPVPIIMTKLMSPLYDTYNTAIYEICADPNNFAYWVETSDAPLRDTNHWNYAGMKIISSRMADVSTYVVGLGSQYADSITAAENGTPPVYDPETIPSVSPSLSPSPSLSMFSPSVGVDEFVPFSWGGLANATQNGSNELALTVASTPAGGTATTSIDVTVPFTLEIDYSNAANTAGLVVYIDNDSDATYTWGGGLTFISGIYHPGSSALYVVADGSTPIETNDSLAGYPAKVRMEKSGNDVVYSMSTDGENFSAVHTHTGVLAGRTVAYVKALFAIPAAGQKIKVSALSTGMSPSPSPLSPSMSFSPSMSLSPSPDPGGGGQTLVDWTSTSNATDSGDFLTLNGTTIPAGGLGTMTVDATQDFVVEIRYQNQASGEAVVVFLDSDNTASYTWESNLAFNIGIYHFSGTVYAAPNGYAAVNTGGTYAPYLRMTKSGNNVVFSRSTDGSNFTDFYTANGVLSGATTLYLKALFAVGNSGARVSAYIIQ